MAHLPGRVPRVDAPAASLVRAELERILASPLFARSDRLSAFLSFIVEQTLGGHGDSLKEHAIAIELYGKGADFNAAADPIVRVDARRLRDKLREYYAAQPHDPVVISVPKGSYTPVFDTRPVVRESGESPPVPAADAGGDGVDHATYGYSRRVVAVGVATVLTVVGVTLAINGRHADPPPIRLLRATAFPGTEGGPATISPDGNSLVVAWTAPDMKLGDLWVKDVDGEATRRLTDTPTMNEVSPVWSPDGLRIAFVRYSPTANLGIFVMSRLGGEETRVVERGVRPSWMPDTQGLVFVDSVNGVTSPYLVRFKTGERRRLTTPPAGFFDSMPSVSPDGLTLAFVRTTGGQIAPIGTSTKAALFVVAMAGGEPRQLDDWARSIHVPAWTPSGRELLFARSDGDDPHLYRIALAGGRRAPVGNLQVSVTDISASQARPDGGFRLAFPDIQRDIGMRAIDAAMLESKGEPSAWVAFCDSTRIDWPGRFSRDGQQVSFTSDRDGPQQILVASRDGSKVRTVTTFDGLSLGLASWSPDGERLVFDGVDAKGVHGLYVVSAAGGPARPLAQGSDRRTNPEWSRDGKWIYFVASASGQKEIWKVQAAGGVAVQLTTEGGDEPREAPDGKTLYFLALGQSPYVPTSLRQMSVDGGTSSPLLPGIRPAAWDVTDAGIVFLSGSPGIIRDSANPDVVDFFSFADHRIRRLGEIPFPVTGRGYQPARVLIASPDGRSIVVSHMDKTERDILVADNLR